MPPDDQIKNNKMLITNSGGDQSEIGNVKYTSSDQEDQESNKQFYEKSGEMVKQDILDKNYDNSIFNNIYYQNRDGDSEKNGEAVKRSSRLS